MGILEIVFNSRKFDLNDDVLMGFDNYFDKPIQQHTLIQTISRVNRVCEGTVLPISQIERYIEKSGVAEPSNISFVGDSDECGNYKVWIIAQEENNPHIIELTDRKKIDHMIILYWD